MLSQLGVLSAMDNATPTSVITVALGGIALIVACILLSRPNGRLPPGPKGLPVIGNSLDLPSETPWLVYLDWSKAYNSDVISLTFPGRHLIVLNSTKAVNDLLIKRATNYSDRPQSTMFSKLMNLNWVLGLMRYTPHWREHRKHFRAHFEHKGSPTVRRHELSSARRLICRLYKNKSSVNYSRDLQLSTADTILSVTYGITPRSEDDYLIQVAESLVKAMGEIANSGYIVDMYPIFRFIPSWFPGASFKRKARQWKKYGIDARNVPFDRTKSEVSQGIAAPSVAAEFLSAVKGTAEDSHMEDIMRDIMAEAYLGGAGATVGNLCSFILAIVFYPEVQKRAQAEIDAITGGDRLPDFSDMDKIPYVTAMVEETLRWHPGAPLGVFHAATEDDEYNGFYIPKGSMVSANVFALLHDEAVYGASVEEYIPERFLNADGKRNKVPDADPAFGFGRRICAGRGMGREMLWITIASILAVFTVSDPVDIDGKPLRFKDIVYSNSSSSRPQYFDCKFTRRPLISESMILSGEADAADN